MLRKTDKDEQKASTGIALIKKGRDGVIHALFSRFGIIVLIFLIQLFFLILQYRQ